MAFLKVKAEFPEKLPCKIAICGEAPGEDEALSGKPFVGNSGNLFNKLLDRAGVTRSSCLVTNIFDERPINNEIKRFFISRSEAKAKGLKFPEAPHTLGWIAPPYRDALKRLTSELTLAKPNVIVAVGGISLYALTQLTGILKYRGTLLEGTLFPCKVLPTIHPSAAFDKWDYCPVIVADLAKAKREAEFPEIRRKKRNIYVAENESDLEWFYNTYGETNIISFDLETDDNPPRITSYTIAVDPFTTLVVNVDYLGDDLTLRHLRKWQDKAWIGQNILYDLTWVAEYDIKPKRIEDTMLLHHAWQLELPKSLGFLGSLYCDEAAWKEWRTKAKGKVNKDNE